MRVYSISEAARLLGVHRATLHRWIQEKLVPAPGERMFAGVRVKCWTGEDMVKLRQYKASQYWGKGKSRSKSKEAKQKKT